MTSLFDDAAPAEDLPSACARAARAALAGLLAPQALIAVASSAGAPLRSGIGLTVLLGALAGFGLSGVMLGAALGRGRRVTAWGGVALLLTGTAVTPAFTSLQGLTGREPVAIIVGTILGGFMGGFAMAGGVLAAALHVAAPAVRRVVLWWTVAGGAGGAFALLPYGWSLWGPGFPGSGYVHTTLTVAAFLGCLIVPFRWGGVILARALATEALRR